MIQCIYDLVKGESNSDMEILGETSISNSMGDIEDICDFVSVDAKDVGTAEAIFPSMNVICWSSRLHSSELAAASINIVDQKKTSSGM
jgi:hypothetical protein